MMKKVIVKHKKLKEEPKVENIYGVHFKYQDLFSRLLKVQKERKLSEEKSPIPRVPSFDSVNTIQTSNSKQKKENNIKRNITSSVDLKPSLDRILFI